MVFLASLGTCTQVMHIQRSRNTHAHKKIRWQFKHTCVHRLFGLKHCSDATNLMTSTLYITVNRHCYPFLLLGFLLVLACACLSSFWHLVFKTWNVDCLETWGLEVSRPTLVLPLTCSCDGLFVIPVSGLLVCPDWWLDITLLYQWECFQMIIQVDVLVEEIAIFDLGCFILLLQGCKKKNIVPK